MPPKIGQFLYASCAGGDYGKILDVRKDENGADVMDIELFDVQSLADTDGEDPDFPSPPLTQIKLPPGTVVILESVQWRHATGSRKMIICNTPGNGCFRCTKLFSLQETHTPQ